MKKIAFLLAVISSVTHADTTQDQYNEIQRQKFYTQSFFHSEDGEIAITFNQLKHNQASNTGFISEITMCNALCKSYKFANNEVNVINPSELPYHMFTQKIESNVTLNGFLCKENAPSCNSYVTIEKDYNNKKDFFEVLYLDADTTQIAVKRKYN